MMKQRLIALAIFGLVCGQARASCDVWEDINIPGLDLNLATYVEDRQDSWEECRDLCNDRPFCNFFEWHKWTGDCWMKSGISRKVTRNGTVSGSHCRQGKLNTNDPCDQVYNSGFDFPKGKGCSQLVGSLGGGYLEPKACRAKCNANPTCELWQTEKTEKRDTPWCWNYGNKGRNGWCHDARFRNAVEPGTFSGLSGCNPCDKVYNSGFDFPKGKGCIQLVGSLGGGYLEPKACRAKCNANPTCELWQTEKTEKRDTPWCWNYGNKGRNGWCHDARFRNAVEPGTSSGLSGC